MSRRKVLVEPNLTSWSDVDRGLKLIGELEGILGELEVDMNRQIAAAKEASDKQAQPLHEKIKALEKDIKAFVKENREGLDGKSKKLTFGSTGYRSSTKVVIPKDLPKEEFIAVLKRQGLHDCIKKEETIIRDVLKTHTKDEINATGAYLKTTDDFWYEVDKELLRSK